MKNKQGLKYLHDSPIGFHGFLSSANCLIDSRWLLKITDFGSQKLYQLLCGKPEKRSPSDLLTVAPEILSRGIESLHYNGSREADIYSFSIIMAEIIAVEPLPELFSYFATLSHSPDPSPSTSSSTNHHVTWHTPVVMTDRIISQMIDRIIAGDPILIRPKFEKPLDVPEDAMALMSKGWNEDPSERPTIRSVNESLRKLLSPG